MYGKEKKYIMFYKPRGCITARRDEKHMTVMEYFPPDYANELFLVGRLDKDTEGLLFLTNDGQFDQMLMHPDYHTSKTYRFIACGTLQKEQIDRIEKGMLLAGEEKMTKPAKLTIIAEGRYEDYESVIMPQKKYRDNEFNRNRPVIYGELTISEGRKHQVKRMLLSEGCRVVYLKRIAIGDVRLDDELKPGEYRNLSADEIEALVHNQTDNKALIK